MLSVHQDRGALCLSPRKVREPAGHRSVVSLDEALQPPENDQHAAVSQSGSLVDDFSAEHDHGSLQQQRTADAFISNPVGQDLQQLNALARQAYSSDPNNNNNNEATTASAVIDPNPGNIDIFTYLTSDFPEFMTQEPDVGFLGFLTPTLEELTGAPATSLRGTALSAPPPSASDTGPSTTGPIESSVGLQLRSEPNSALSRLYAMEVPPDIVGDM